MSFKFNPQKRYKLPYKDKENSAMEFYIVFKFPYTEDIAKVKDEHPIEMILRVVRDSMKETDIVDENTGKPVDLTKVENRKAIVDLIKTLPEYIIDISVAFMGPKGKNLLTGAMQSLTTDGHPKSATPASPTV